MSCPRKPHLCRRAYGGPARALHSETKALVMRRRTARLFLMPHDAVIFASRPVLCCRKRGRAERGPAEECNLVLVCPGPCLFPTQNNDLSEARAFQLHRGLLCRPDSSPDYLEACQAVRFSLSSLLFLPNRHETVQSIIFYLSSHCVSLLLISLGGFDCRKSEGRLRSEKFSQMLSASEMLLRERPPKPLATGANNSRDSLIASTPVKEPGVCGSSVNANTCIQSSYDGYPLSPCHSHWFLEGAARMF